MLCYLRGLTAYILLALEKEQVFLMLLLSNSKKLKRSTVQSSIKSTYLQIAMLILLFLLITVKYIL